MWFHRLPALVVAALLLRPQPALAQQPVPAGRRPMVGFVRDVKGGPLEGVSVQVHGERITTDKRGAFLLLTSPVDTASIAVRRVGFEPIDAFISTRNGMWDTVIVQMDAAATKLSEVKVTENFSSRAGGIRGFEERQKRGMGQFVTRNEIVDRGSQQLSDILRSKKGVLVVRGRLRFAAFAGGRSTVCQPNVFLDGAKAPGMEVDEITAQSVEAVELYPNMSSIPMEFQTVGAQTNPCGTVVIWTRIPNSKGR
jgi:hypothetical protein